MLDVCSITTLLYLTLVRPLCSMEGYIVRGPWPNIKHVRTSSGDGKESWEFSSLKDGKGIGYICPGREMKRSNKIHLQIF